MDPDINLGFQSTDHFVLKIMFGSAGKMGVDGIFRRSETERGLKCKEYKTSAAVSESKQCGIDFKIKIVEYVGHIQKRMGTRLRKMKSVLVNKKFSDGKTIGGKGQLTETNVKKLTSYYGNAIRDNSISVNDEAIYFGCMGSYRQL